MITAKYRYMRVEMYDSDKFPDQVWITYHLNEMVKRIEDVPNMAELYVQFGKYFELNILDDRMHAFGEMLYANDGAKIIEDIQCYIRAKNFTKQQRDEYEYGCH